MPGPATEDLTPFAAALRSSRIAAGLSQIELARLLDVTQGSVSRWEIGMKQPDREHVFYLEQALNVAPGTLSSLLPFSTPAKASGRSRRPASTRQAILADEKLTKTAKNALLATYQALISPSRCTVPSLEAA